MEPCLLKSLNNVIQCDVGRLIRLSSDPNVCICIKDHKSNYLYGNPNFIKLMGLKSNKELCRSSDIELSKNVRLARRYRDIDLEVLDTRKELQVSEEVSPKLNMPVQKIMEGQFYPYLSPHSQVEGVLGIITPKDKHLALSFDLAFTYPIDTLKKMLSKRSYLIHLKNFNLQISKMEILLLVLLLKGKHAGEIASDLAIKQTTVESYIANIKNKFGASTRSELIDFVIKHDLFSHLII